MLPWYFFWPLVGITIPFWYLVIGMLVGTVLVTYCRNTGNESLLIPTETDSSISPVSIWDDADMIRRISYLWGLMVVVLVGLALCGEEEEHGWDEESV